MPPGARGCARYAAPPRGRDQPAARSGLPGCHSAPPRGRDQPPPARIRRSCGQPCRWGGTGGLGVPPLGEAPRKRGREAVPDMRLPHAGATSPHRSRSPRRTPDTP
ncbi:hypothetical protein Stsp02_54110 [Streptomyces sp. NBRC 14336]|nr:hypothetical protein Stsp02_54110 [Streptomyces sp. NBRC 14336]